MGYKKEMVKQGVLIEKKYKSLTKQIEGYKKTILHCQEKIFELSLEIKKIDEKRGGQLSPRYYKTKAIIDRVKEGS